TVNSGSFMQINNGFNVNVSGNITNNGVIGGAGTTATTITFNGTTAQQIVSGTTAASAWLQTGTNGYAYAFPGFIFNNTSGASPSVDIRQNLALTNTLTLTAGSVGSTTGATLTLGIGVQGTAYTLTGTVTGGTWPVTGSNLLGTGYN